MTTQLTITLDALEKARAELRAGHGIPHQEVVAGTRAIIEAAIGVGMADLRAGRITPHEEVMTQARAVIAETAVKRQRDKPE